MLQRDLLFRILNFDYPGIVHYLRILREQATAETGIYNDFCQVEGTV